VGNEENDGYLLKKGDDTETGVLTKQYKADIKALVREQKETNNNLRMLIQIQQTNQIQKMQDDVEESAVKKTAVKKKIK